MKWSPLEMDWLRRVGEACGIDLDQEITQSLKSLLHPEALPGMSALAAGIAEVIMAQGWIGVVGDYDADGMLSTALMVRALRAMGAKNLFHLIPDRMEDGYGLSITLLKKLPPIDKGPACLITVDNGIRAFEAAKAVRLLGWRLYITDHHTPDAELPEADGCVNPKVAVDPEGKGSALAGVGVAFMVALALKITLTQQNWFKTQGLLSPDFKEYLDLVALGTIADMVPMDLHNRLLVRQGLRQMRQGQASIGVQTLLERLGYGQEAKPLAYLQSKELSFQVIPLINAAGRLNRSDLALKLLLAEHKSDALEAAQALAELNQQRRLMQSTMMDEALAQMAAIPKPPSVVVVAQPAWHCGIVGVLASQLKERFQAITFVLGRGPEGHWRGSGRSLEGTDLTAFLTEIQDRYPDLLMQFGGHAQAAGLTLMPHPQGVEPFRLACEAVFAQRPTPAMSAEPPAILTPFALLHAGVYQRLHHWIMIGHPATQLQFEGDFQVITATPLRRILGYRVTLSSAQPQKHQAPTLEGIYFHPKNGGPLPPMPKRILARFQMKMSFQNFRTQLELALQSWSSAEDQGVCEISTLHKEFL